MASDWKDALAGLMASGNLPEGEADAHNEPTEEKVRQTEALNIVYERKGRGGKSATIIEGFTLPDNEVEEIAKQLRRTLGTGGSSRGGEILLQGDCRRKVADRLKELGFRVKGGFN